jgi:aryl sulfotransferase
MRDAGMVWIASYPKSGNTWVRSFLSACQGEEGAFDLNALAVPITANRSLIDDLLGISTADLSPGEVRALLPHAFEAWLQCSFLRPLAKTHDAYALVGAGQAMYPADLTRAVLHVVRDPRDVAVSLAHHHGIGLDAAIVRLNDAGAWLAAEGVGRTDQIAQFVSDWSGHARSWIESPLPRLTLRYEDLLADPRAGFARLLEFAGLRVAPQRFDQALRETSFANLQAREKSAGFVERRANATAPFFRQGRAGGWRETLSPAQVAAIESAHGAMMARFGYLGKDAEAGDGALA